MKVTYTVLFALLLAAAVFFDESDAQGRRKKNKRRKNRRRRPRPQPPQDCGPIPHLDHAQALQTPEGVHYACQPGYRLQGTNVITCIDGRWTVAPRCVREICPAPPMVAFANPPQLSASGTSVTYTCQSGYRIVNGNGASSVTLNCNVPLQQWPALPQCEQIPTQTCGAPPNIGNARSEVSGNTATYTCNTGYLRKSGTPSQIQCVGTSWSYTTAPACDVDPSTTPAPPKCNSAPPCGGSTIMRGPVADSYDIGSKVKYTCITGYRLVGSNNNAVREAEVECKSDGTWSTVPTCEPVVCGQPVHATGGNTQVLAATSITYNSQYTYQCVTLYETSSPTVATCQADGQWSITPPTCTRRVCTYASLPTLTNGVTWNLVAGVDIPVGENVTYRCNSDYRIAPSTPTEGNPLQTIQCLSTGAWGSFTYSCVYRYPSSCRDYFNRDNLFASAAVGTTATVEIDTDGAGTTASPSTVTCVKSSTTDVCTRVSPTSGTTLGNEVTSCTATSTPILPGVVFSGDTGATGTAAVCDSTTVGYPLSSTQIASLLSSSQNCRQTVSVACMLAGAGDGNAVAILGNGQTRGTTYSAVSALIGVSDLEPATDFVSTAVASGIAALTSSPCDCNDATSCTGCSCSTNTAGTKSDTITLTLSGTNPAYVTQYARIGGDPGANDAAPAIGAAEYDVTVNDIECCETA